MPHQTSPATAISKARLRMQSLPARVVGALALLAVAIFAGVRWDLSKSDWAAWVQAVGSIGAILVAIAVVQFQHSRQSKVEAEKARIERRGQLNVLKWQFNMIAETCNGIADMIGREHVAWFLQAQVLRERRNVLASFPITHFPDASLLIRAQDLSHRLLIAAAVVDSLEVPRKEITLRHCADLLRAARDEALVGVTEATGLVVKISSAMDIKTDWETLDAREENKAMTLKVMEELGLDQRGAPPFNSSIEQTTSASAEVAAHVER